MAMVFWHLRDCSINAQQNLTQVTRQTAKHKSFKHIIWYLNKFTVDTFWCDKLMTAPLNCCWNTKKMNVYFLLIEWRWARCPNNHCNWCSTGHLHVCKIMFPIWISVFDTQRTIRSVRCPFSHTKDATCLPNCTIISSIAWLPN